MSGSHNWTSAPAVGSRAAILQRVWRRYGVRALTSYAIVVIFGIAYGITRLMWPKLPEGHAVIIGLLVAGPLVVAYIWERLVGVKLFGVELTLAQFTVGIEATLQSALSASQYFSDNPKISGIIEKLAADETIELLEINLHNEPYWWDTRLFLQAALIEDYTAIERLVFVDGDRRYLGMAAPRQVRMALAQLEVTNLELVYQQTADSSGHVVQKIIETWSTQPMFIKPGQPLQTDEGVHTKLSCSRVSQHVNLETTSVEWLAPLDSALLQDLVLEKGTRYVALTHNGRLEKVVNADAFARRAASQIVRPKS